jgi:hypothetical protein
MTKKSLVISDDEDLDALIDKAVDTFFVEAPTLDELGEEESVVTSEVGGKSAPKASGGEPDAPSFDEAMDTLFTGSFTETQVHQVTSGDDETDRAIDLAVDTLFVEEPETPPPETAQLEVKVAEAPAQELSFDEFQIPEPPAPKPKVAPKPAVPQKPPAAPQKPPAAGVVGPESRRPKPAAPVAPIPPRKPAPPKAQPPAPEFSPPVFEESPDAGVSYDDAMAAEIERHMHTLYEDEPAPAAPKPSKPLKPATQAPVPEASKGRAASAKASPLRKLQEAILTLEWEISQRSIAVLATELTKVRMKYQDNATVDFAALTMRVVLDYIAKRMSRAHPESIRFLLEVTEYLDRSVTASEEDPLRSFHHILTRYERYKTSVRKAEGLPDKSPPILHNLEVKDPKAFAEMVEMHAKTLIRAGRALAQRLPKTRDPENLIRSFRFLVTRSINRVLESTVKEKAKKSPKNKGGRKK